MWYPPGLGRRPLRQPRPRRAHLSRIEDSRRPKNVGPLGHGWQIAPFEPRVVLGAWTSFGLLESPFLAGRANAARKDGVEGCMTKLGNLDEILLKRRGGMYSKR